MRPHRVLALGDLHFGKKTRLGYNLKTAARRVKTLSKKLGGDRPGDLWIMLLGDLVEGSAVYLHQDSVLDAGAMDQKRVCTNSLVVLIREIKKMWPRTKIHVRAVPGNHGRFNRVGDPISNHDTEVVERLKDLLPRIDIKPSRHVAEVVDVGGCRIAIMHRSEKHANSGAYLNRVRDRLTFYKADLILAGHWHTPKVYSTQFGQPIYVSNGAMCGVDDLGERNAWYSPARQAVFDVVDGVPCNFGWLQW